MPAPVGQACETCRFYFDAPAHGAFDGECHRYAPQPGSACVQPWPLVQANAWCGEWEAQPPEPEPPGQATDIELVAGTPRPQ